MPTAAVTQFTGFVFKGANSLHYITKRRKDQRISMFLD